MRNPMARVARTLEPLLAPIDGAILENKTWTLSVHYRLVERRDRAAIASALLDGRRSAHGSSE